MRYSKLKKQGHGRLNLGEKKQTVGRKTFGEHQQVLKKNYAI